MSSEEEEGKVQKIERHMTSGFRAPGICGRCGHSLTGKLKDEFMNIKPSQRGGKGWAEILRDPKNFKLFGCLDCGTESTNLADLTALTPELELKRALQRKVELERSIPFYEDVIPKMREELAQIEMRLPELMRKVGEH